MLAAGAFHWALALGGVLRVPKSLGDDTSGDTAPTFSDGVSQRKAEISGARPCKISDASSHRTPLQWNGSTAERLWATDYTSARTFTRRDGQ